MAKKEKVSKNNDLPRMTPPRNPPVTNLDPLPAATVNDTSGGSNAIDYREIGATGLRRFTGFIHEEFLPELTGWQGVAVYTEMKKNDATVGAVLFAIKMLCRKVKWFTDPGGKDQQDLEAAEFLETCLNDMSQTWIDTVDEILSMLEYGYSAHEIVYKRRCGNDLDPSMRSEYSDGRIGWRKIPVRSQDTVYRWQFDDHGGIQGLEQLAPPHYYHVTIPVEKMLLFRTTIAKNNPEGCPLTLDTLIPTPSGWTTIGEIKVGDYVYDEAGKIRHVTAKSEVFENRPTYEMEFSTGHIVHADASHLWNVTTANDRHNSRSSRTMTTEEIASEMGRQGKQHFSCGTAPTLGGVDTELPVDPYLLGYWLGNGAHTKAELACNKTDVDFINSQVFEAGFSGKVNEPNRLSEKANISVSGGFLVQLRAANVLGDKHIPSIYMRASIDQRLALLQGLMDSDGHSPGSKCNDTASAFHNTNQTLISQVAEVVRSLGGRPGVKLRQKAGRHGGFVGGRQIVARRDLHEVRFHLAAPVHRLPRKLERQVFLDSSRVTEHFIKSITRVDNADTQCIEVDSPSHLFLCGEGMVPTHNSILRTAYRSWHMKKNIENIEAIGVERDLAGLPMAFVPAEALSRNASQGQKDLVAAIKEIVVNVRRNAQEGMVFPQAYDPTSGKPLYEFKLLSTGGQRQFDTSAVINRYDQRIAMSMLADFILLGQDKAGSYALSSTKTNLFSTAIGAFLDIIADVMNRYAIPRLFALNDFKITAYPKIKHGDLGSVDLNEVSQYIQRLSQSGMPIFPNPDLEKHLLDIAGMPTAHLSEPEQPMVPMDLGLGDVPTEEIPFNPKQSPTEGFTDRTPADGQPPVSTVTTNADGDTETLASRPPYGNK